MLTLDLTINGLIIGVFYALMAIGLSLIFGILKIVNFAHGEFYTVGAYAYTLVALALGVPPWLALPFAFLVGVILGLVVERLLMRPLYSSYASWGVMRDEYAVIITFGLSLLLINLVDKIVGPYAYKGPPLVGITRMVLGPIRQRPSTGCRHHRHRGHRRDRAGRALFLLGSANPGGGAEPARSLTRRHRHRECERHRLRARWRTCCYFGCPAGQHLQSDTRRGRVSGD